MAVHGFSIFLGFIPIAIFSLIFIMLYSFKKFREDFRKYYDALFSGCTAVKLSIYYAAYNYPEDATSTGERNLLMCILIMVAYLGFHTASLGFLTAGGFWHMMRAKVQSSMEPKPEGSRAENHNQSSDDNDGPKTVRFVKTVDDPKQQRFFKNLNNKIMLSVVVFTFMVPVLYILIDVFKGSDANIIHSYHRCWIAGGLMYVFMFIPTILGEVMSIALYIQTGILVDAKTFFKLRPFDHSIHNIQLRVLFVTASGLWWLIQHPVLGKGNTDATAVQYLNGVLFIPLAILAFYIFVCETDEVFKHWDEAVPIGAKIRRKLVIHWKYDVHRPAQKKLNSMKASKRSKNSEESSNPPENDYNAGVEHNVEYDDHEFQPPVEYDNEGQDNALYESDNHSNTIHQHHDVQVHAGQESPEYIEPLPVSETDSPQYDNSKV